MTSQVNNPGDVRCDSVALDANQMADKLMALQIEPAEGPEDAQLPKDRTSGFGTNEHDTTPQSEPQPNSAFWPNRPRLTSYASSNETQHGSNTPLSNQPGPSQQPFDQPRQWPQRHLSGNEFQNNHNMGASMELVLQVPKAFHNGYDNTHHNYAQQYNHYGFSAQSQQSSNLPPSPYQTSVPTLSRTVPAHQPVHQFRGDHNARYFGPLPSHHPPWPLTITRPEDEDIRDLGYEDALILVDSHRKTRAHNTPIKAVLDEVAHELSQRSLSANAQGCRLDRSTGELSSEHVHICRQKMALISPLYMNTNWEERDEYTQDSVCKLSQMSEADLLTLLGDRTRRTREQRKKGTLHCEDCNARRAEHGGSSLQFRMDDTPETTTKILVGGLPRHATKHDVLVLFQPRGLPISLNFGPIKDIRRPKECAFVTFSDRRNAEQAMNRMQGYPLDAKKNVRLRLSWGRQQNR
ncbi:hypothetical protein EG327_008823 [Venturia inaequalis]|uniref:RRM domain-containing protein n=1 Tax=Venturia inaequalis TaxID=5025 RepID=A0A8H3URD3_VENIN|nr:hypothetical protein EG327_008823 [Venturia inaequalis]